MHQLHAQPHPPLAHRCVGFQFLCLIIQGDLLEVNLNFCLCLCTSISLSSLSHTLSFPGCIGIGDGTMLAIQTTQPNKIRWLDVTGCNSITDLGIEALGMGCPVS